MWIQKEAQKESGSRKARRRSAALLLIGLACYSLFAMAASAAPSDAGLRLNRIDTKAGTALAQKPGGPTERIEIQTTDDHIDYVVKSYVLRQANAAEVYELIKAAIALEGGYVDRIADGSIVSTDVEGREVEREHSGESILVVTVPDWMIPYLDATIAMLDRPGLESAAFGTGAAFLPIRHRLPSEVADLIAASSASPSIILQPDDTRQILYMEDTPSFFEGNLQALRTFDVPPPQIETRVRIYEIDETQSKDVGLDWYAWKKSISGGELTAIYEASPGSYNMSLQSLSAELSFTPQLATEFLNYMVSRNNARVVTDSRLTQINSIPAVVQSVTQIPYVIRGWAGDGVADSPLLDSPGAWHADGFIKEFLEGVVIEMTPRIGHEIEIAVSASVASLVGYTPNQSVPLITESTVDTVVLLEPGKAAVLGGLSRQSKVTGRTGIPGLKSVPGLKHLFSRTVERELKSQIIVTIELDRVQPGGPQFMDTPDMAPAALGMSIAP